MEENIGYKYGMEALLVNVKKFTKIINNLEEKPGGTLRLYGEWFGRPFDNYHKILECMFKDRILHIIFETGEKIKVWNPDKITFNNSELMIKDSTCVEFLRYYQGKPQIEENLIIDRYSNDALINSSIKSGMFYKKFIKKGYPAVELFSF